jgi:hypothetical protein
MRFHWLTDGRFVAGTILAGLTLTISGNALFFQSARHPAPLFFTRPSVVKDAAPPLPEARGPGARSDTDPVMQPKARPDTKVDQGEASRPQADPIVLAIQQALADAAYGPVAIDGIAGRETTDAIRRFQLDQGMEVTGRIDDRLISRLISVGAMAQR